MDSTAKIASDGLLGGAFVSIEPGGAEDMLPPGGQFENTQGSVDLITLFAGLAGGAAPKQTNSGATTP
jgi:phospholipid/cholesterol/gamma-HCH transport system substrate-binding protein